MSEFIAEAQVLVVPNTKAFAISLKAQVEAAVARAGPIAIPVVPVAAGGTGAATAAFNTLNTSQSKLIKTSQEVAGAQEVVRRSTEKSTAALLGAGSATARLDAGLLGLRTALGSTAVIGLGALALAAIAAGKAVRASITDFANFETELNVLQATTGATAEQMTRVSDAAKQLGADVTLPAVSSADAAQAMTELAKAGLSVEDAIAGARGVLELATAANISNAEAVDITASALNAFGLAGDQAVRVADDLANAANAAQGSISDFGLALRQAEAVAEQVGLSLEDTVSLLTLFARNGLRGSDAGTSLRVALIKLIAPTKQADALIQSLGLHVRDLNGNVRPDVFAQFGEATRLLSADTRDMAAALIFGQDSIRAVAIGAREGTQGLAVAQAQIDQQGTAAQLAAARTKGLAGEFEGLKSTAQTLGVQLGGLASGPIASTISGLTDIISAATRAGEALAKIKPPSGGFDFLPEGVRDLFLFLSPGAGFERFGEALSRLSGGSDDLAKKLAPLLEELDRLQKLKIAELKLGIDPGFTTAEIKNLRAEIAGLQREAAGLSFAPPATDLARLQELRKQAVAVRDAFKEKQDFAGLQSATGTIEEIDRAIKKLRDSGLKNFKALAEEGPAAIRDAVQEALKIFEIDPTGQAADRALADVRRLVKKLGDVAPEAGASGRKIALSLADALQKAIIAAAAAGRLPAARALKALVDQLAADTQTNINNAFGKIKVPLLGDEIDKALQSSGVGVARAEATGGDVKSALEARLQVVKDLIASGRATGADLEDLFNEQTSINNQIAAIEQKIVDDAEERQKDRFERFQERLAAALRPTETLLVRAAGNELLGDDIKFREQLIKILQGQVAIIRKTLGNTKDARELIRAIQDRVLDEVAKLKKDRAAFRKQLRDALVERQERIIRGIQLDIDLADINENTKRSINLRKQLIAQLKKEAKVLHLQGNALKENRNERARLQKEIEDLEKQAKDTNTAGQSFFKFLQTQQGFAANLLGNLIPGFATKGLVGGSTPMEDPRQAALVTQPRLDKEAAIASSKERGVRPVQVDTTNHLLRQILRSLQNLNGKQTHPEARYQKSVSGGAMDTL